MTNLEEGLGQVLCVARSSGTQRLFLGPLHRGMAMHPRRLGSQDPRYVSFFLRFFFCQVRVLRHMACAVEINPATAAPRVDAQASGTRTGTGKWELEDGCQ